MNRLKQTLKNDVNLLDNVSGIDSFILVVLKSELNSQIDKLDADTLKDMKEELSIIKEWVDSNVTKQPASEEDGDSDSDDYGEPEETPETLQTPKENSSPKILP